MAEPISINDFARIDLRVGRVTEVKPHPNADKLYVLQVDLGALGTRQLVAGLKQHYTPEELQGQSIVVVVNLEPATLRGETSEGMLLAAQAGDDVVHLTAAKPIAPGAKIL